MTSCCFLSSRAVLVLVLALVACAAAGCASVLPAGTVSPPAETPTGEGRTEPATGVHESGNQEKSPASGGAEPAAAPGEAETAAMADQVTGTPAAPVDDRPATATGMILGAPAAAPAVDRPGDERPAATGGSAGSSAGASSSGAMAQVQERGDAPGQVVFRLSASPAVIRVRDSVTVEVRASSSARVVDAPLHLVYDAARLRYLGGEEGDFLNRDGSGTVFLINGLSQPGVVTIGLGRLDRSHGLSGAGTHCRVRFEVIAPGRSRVAVGQAMAWADDGSMLSVGTDAIEISAS